LRDVRSHELRADRRSARRQLTAMRAIALAMIACALPSLAPASGPFDSPLKTRNVRLAADPQNPKVRRQVTCFYYRSIVIKQVDYGEVGADRLALLPVLSRNATQCHEDREALEYVIPADTWSGYFRGVKADYAFFDAPDGINGGLGFMVLRLFDRKAVLEDVAQHGIKSINYEEGVLRLHYQRVYAGNCSILTAGEDCRDALVRDTGVSAGSLSICPQGYRAAKEAMAKARCSAQASRRKGCFEEELDHLGEQKWNEAPTVIVYEAEATLKDGTFVTTPRSDALACHPSD
jgi:hypothetical protein